MIYNSGEFLGVPWEVIVKEFRVHAGDRNFPTLQAFAFEFVGFVKSARFADSRSELLSFGLVFSDMLDTLFEELEYKDRHEMQIAIVDTLKANEQGLIDIEEIHCPFTYEKFAQEFRVLIIALAKDELKFSMR